LSKEKKEKFGGFWETTTGPHLLKKEIYAEGVETAFKEKKRTTNENFSRKGKRNRNLVKEGS